MNFIDVSGVGNSGKSAVVDLLRELSHFYVPEYWFEFDFIWIWVELILIGFDGILFD